MSEDATGGPVPATAPTSEEPLVKVRELEKHFYEDYTIVDRLLREDRTAVQAVDGISFDVRAGETLGLVGESGCGKSTTGETLLQLQEQTGGTVSFDGTALSERDDLTAFRKRAQIVFQDPFASLDPRMTVGSIIRQPLEIHDIGTPGERQVRAAELIERVGLSEAQLERYPHEFSGGQQQRVCIARALALEPDFIVLDEPTSALDVSVQAQILNLLADLQADFDLTYLFISHDLGVIRYICDRIAVMYLGEIVEIAATEEIFDNPQHPYTEALLESVPRADTSERARDIDPLVGDVPSPRNPPSGCRFRTRCPKVIPPDGCTLDQSAYRAVMDLRQLVAAREISIEQATDDLEEDADTDAVARRLTERLVEVDLPVEHANYVRDAMAHVAEKEWEKAEETLREHYESVCETEHPTGARATCHLLEDDSG